MKQKIAAMLAAALTLSALTACGGVSDQQGAQPAFSAGEAVETLDAQSLFLKMRQTINGRLATSLTDKVEIETKVGTGWLSAGAGLTAETDVRLKQEPFACYTSSRITASLMMVELSESVELYSARENQGLSNYYHREKGDAWFHQQVTMVPTDLLGQYALTECKEDWVPRNLTLDSQTYLIEERETYCLKCTYDAEGVLSALSSPLGDISLSGLDLSAVKLETTYYVNVETCLPVRIEIAYQGMSAVIGDVVADFVQDYLGRSLDLQVGSYQETLSGIRYDEVEVPSAPDEAAEKAREVTDLDISEFLKQS